MPRLEVVRDPAVLAVLPAGSVGTRAECGRQQAYGVDLLPNRIHPGVMACVITPQRRYALLRITSVTVGAQNLPIQVTLDIRVWETRDAD